MWLARGWHEAGTRLARCCHEAGTRLARGWHEAGTMLLQPLNLCCTWRFVWVKTMQGTRTKGFFALQCSDGRSYASDGTELNLPSVVLFGNELIKTICKSAPKGIYACAWKETSEAWCRILHQASEEQQLAYTTIDNAIMTTIGFDIPKYKHCSKDVVAEKKAAAKAKKEMIKLEFEKHIITTLKLLKPMTVGALCPRRLYLT